MLGQNLGRKSMLTRAQKRVKEPPQNALRAIQLEISPGWIFRILPAGRGLPLCAPVRYILSGGSPMPGPIVCNQCDKTEQECVCGKYCTICKGQDKVRLCSDGLYYCPDCREACDVALANYRGD